MDEPRETEKRKKRKEKKKKRRKKGCGCRMRAALLMRKPKPSTGAAWRGGEQQGRGRKGAYPVSQAGRVAGSVGDGGAVLKRSSRRLGGEGHTGVTKQGRREERLGRDVPASSWPAGAARGGRGRGMVRRVDGWAQRVVPRRRRGGRQGQPREHRRTEDGSGRVARAEEGKEESGRGGL